MKVSLDEWWDALTDYGMEGVEGVFVHPVADERVMAGNGTIGMEIVEDLPSPDAVLIPFGGGGLTTGIASALRAFAPNAKVYPVEPETGAPLAASLAAGEPQEIDVHAVVRRRRGRAHGAARDVAARQRGSSTAR